MARLYRAEVGRGQTRSGWSAPPVGSARGAHQRGTQITQLGGVGTLVERGDDVLGSASHLVHTVGQVSCLVGRQHHRVRGDRRTLGAADQSALLVGPLPTRLPAVLAASSHRAVGDVAATPSAWLGVDASCHGPDFSRGMRRIPVSLPVGSDVPRELGSPLRR
jgi:hypothetical protein